MISKNKILLAIFLLSLIVIPSSVKADMSYWEQEYQGEMPEMEDVKNFFSDVALFMFGELGEGDEGLLRFLLFILLIVLMYFSLSKIFEKTSYLDSDTKGRKVAIFASVILAYIGARATPSKAIATLVVELGSAIGLLWALLTPGLIYLGGYLLYKTLPDNHYMLRKAIMSITLITGGSYLIMSFWGLLW